MLLLTYYYYIIIIIYFLFISSSPSCHGTDTKCNSQGRQKCINGVQGHQRISSLNCFLGVKSGQVIIGKLLNINHITRYQTEYRCIANNTCGRDSLTMFIDVQCKNISFTWLFFIMYRYNLRIIQPVSYNYKTASGKRKVGIVLIIFLPLLVTKREIIICGVSNIPIKWLRTRPGPKFENSLSVPFRFRLFHPQ